jgi:PKD repeat protein
VKTNHLIQIAFVAVITLLAGCGKDPVPCFEMSSESIDNGDDPIVGEVIEFSNCSEEATSYEWDFGDDSKTSTKTEPTHVYEEPGSYTITLTATGDGGSKSTTKDIDVQASLTGSWEGSMWLSTDEYPIEFEIEQNGTVLTGTFQFQDGSGQSDFSSGSNIDGRDVTIKFTEPTYSMVFKFTGTVNKDFDQMDGNYTLTYGGATTTGTWDVSKAKKKSATPVTGKGLESLLKKF